MRVLAAADKFRGTASAAQVTTAIAAAVARAGGECDQAPVADGGEGTLDVFGGANRTTLVTGPLGDPVEAGWRRDGERAVIEMAAASGLSLVGGPDGNDAMAASTFGTGELIAAALEAGCRRILVGVGGSATTDGGLGAIRAVGPLPRLRPVELVVACDVELCFVDAAEVFAPQKGASPAEVGLLRRRLERLAQVYEDDYGVDVRDLPGSGAAGGLAGGLAAVGAVLVPGFEVVAEEIDLEARLAGVDLVVTGEGHLDDQSFRGKAVGGVAEMAAEAGVPVLVVVGDADRDVAIPAGVDVVSLVERYGDDRSMAEAATLVGEVVAAHLAG